MASTSSSPPDNPPPIVEALRLGPIKQVTLPSGDVGYLVTRYGDTQQVLSHPAFSRAATIRPGGPKYSQTPLEGLRSLLDMDPPEHTRLRALVSKAFTPGRVDAIRPRIGQIVAQRLEMMADAGPTIDLMESLCAPVPILVICQMLGVPYEDLAAFRQVAETIVAATEYPPEQVQQAADEFRAFITALIATKRAAPAGDLLSAMLTVQDYGNTLTESELVNLTGLLLIAGHETTLNQLGKSIYTLLRQPDLYGALVSNPTQVPLAVEELLRIRPAVPGPGFRVTTQDVEIDGTTIPADSAVVVSSATANRDPSAFPDPEEIKFGRNDDSHLTFGHGPHFCLGASLARAEMQVVLTGLVDRFPTLRIAVDPSSITWRLALISGPRQLPVAW